MVEEFSDLSPSCLDGSLCGFSEQVFELGEDLIDRVQVGTVRQQEHEARPDAAEGRVHGGFLVARQVIHNDDVARRESGGEALLDIVGKALAVDGLVEHARGVDLVVTQRRKDGHRPPVAVRHLGV